MDQLDLIRQKINIVDLIGESVTLKKAGRNFKALCPFHSEKTPSFIVSPERQIWHCFGCGKGGDIFGFLMELDRLEFPEALRILAQRAGVRLERRPEESAAAKIKQRLLAIHHLGSEFYHYLLTQHKVGEGARLYLKERGISDAAIKTFYLGFAPFGWDNLSRFLRKKGYTDKELIQAGVALPGQRGLYDRFRGRVIFPLKNYRGETIAFAGRLLKKVAKEAKYINSPETPIYIKGETLYGLDVTREAIRKNGSAVVVEGEFDLISSFQAGVANVVAIKGTALTEPQVNLLKRFTGKLILSLDADTAGEAAARRGIEIADRAGMEIKVAPIPTGKDPDEAARENPNLWKKTVESAVPFYDFLFDSAISRFDKNSAYGKKQISDEVLPVIKKITNTIVQAHYLKKIASILDVSEEKVIEAMNKIKIGRGETSIAPITMKPKTHEQLVEEYLLSLVIQHPDVVHSLRLVTDSFDPSDLETLPIKKIFWELIDFLAGNNNFDLDKFVKKLPAELVQTFDEAYLRDFSALSDPERLDKEILTTINNIKKGRSRRIIKELTTKISGLTENEEEELERLNNLLKLETEKLKTLS